MDYLIPALPQPHNVVPDRWNARWISFPDSKTTRTGVYRFRRRFELTVVPSELQLRVSGDNRYRFFVNGVEVGVGPGRGDLHHWRYETYDISPLLRQGVNVLAAVVWFADGTLAPIAQIGQAPEFLVSSVDNASAELCDTSSEWRCMRAEGHMLFERDEMWTYSVVGPCDRITGMSTKSDWRTADFDEIGWSAPTVGERGEPLGVRDGSGYRWLVANMLPQPVREFGTIEKIVDAKGVTLSENRLSQQSPVRILKNTSCTLLLDNGMLTTAYPQLSVSGGTGAKIRQRYGEALSIPGHLDRKTNRNEIADKILVGYHDEFLPDGGIATFEPLWYRTFRYVQLEIITDNEDLELLSLDYNFTAYPFSEVGRFESNDLWLGDIWVAGWRTARLCAFETYMDCPYYEQLQYGGDTRLQCLISYYVSGDSRLARNAISQLHDSVISSGLTQSRYPSNLTQIIPPFSLWWIGMIHDYWMFVDDPLFVKSVLSAARSVLEWFIDRIDSTGLLGPIAFWPFVDWTEGFPNGVPPGAFEGGSAALTLQLVLALRELAEMESALGIADAAERYRDLAEKCAEATLTHCWSEDRQLIAETPLKTAFSQQTNSLSILADLFESTTAQIVAGHILEDSKEALIQTGFYFRFYQHRALCKVGRAEEYLSWLGDWHDMLAKGLTTFAEYPDPTRSDCHAWSSHPLVGFLDTVIGVRPTKPGFREVTIQPHLGSLDFATGEVPTPYGNIEVKLVRVGDEVKCSYTLPIGITLLSAPSAGGS